MIPRLRVTDLSIHAVGPFNLVVAPGECVGLSGPSGSGKSLFLRAVADLEPHGGTVQLDGTDQALLPAPDWRRQVGLLPAESAWWFDMVGAHFSTPVTEGLQRLALDSRILTWPVARLSSGERQRLALLRLLENRPPLLLLDEPTANLDEENTQRVETLMADYRMQTGAGIVWVGHSKAQLQRMADRIYLMDGGGFKSTTENV